MKTSGLQVTPHMPCQYFWNASYFLVSHYFKPTFTCMLTFACMFAHTLFLHLPLHFKNSTLATITSFLRIGSFTKCYYACHFHIRNPQNHPKWSCILHSATSYHSHFYLLVSLLLLLTRFSKAARPSATNWSGIGRFFRSPEDLVTWYTKLWLHFRKLPVDPLQSTSYRQQMKESTTLIKSF